MEEEQIMLEMGESLTSLEITTDPHFYETPHIEKEEFMSSNLTDDLVEQNNLCKYCIESGHCNQASKNESIDENVAFIDVTVHHEKIEDSENISTDVNKCSVLSDPTSVKRCVNCIILTKLPDFNVKHHEKMECCDPGSLIV